MAEHFVVRLARGPAWKAELPLREQPGWDRHAAFMDALTADGFVLLGGVLGGSEGALLVVSAGSEDVVRARLAADPWQQSRQLQIQRIDSWTILLDSRDA